MKILFCGGGTAGHVYPAVAMSEIIRSKYPDAEFVFIGRVDGSENNIPRSLGIEVHEIDAQGINRRNCLRALGGLFKSLKAVSEARRIIKEASPDIVIGTGGYVSWPVITAARSLRIKTIIHESNAYPGLVTRMLASKADATLLGFESARDKLKRARRVIYTGTPVRTGFKTISRDDARRRLGIPKSAFLVISFGGSLGSGRMNEVIPEAMKKNARKSPRYMHIHACGKRYYMELAELHPELSRKAGTRIIPYLDDAPLWFSAADLAITRSGASTLSELMTARLPAILIPSPNVANDHQSLNARDLSEKGAAILIPESELTAERLADEIEKAIASKSHLEDMKAAMPSDYGAQFYRLFLDLIKELYQH